jgi:hypothetical protein
MDFLCAAGISLDFGVRTVTFEDGTSIPFLNDPHTSEMVNKVVENGDAEGDPPCPPQWEAPFTESPFPLSDDLIPRTRRMCPVCQPGPRNVSVRQELPHVTAGCKPGREFIHSKSENRANEDPTRGKR